MEIWYNEIDGRLIGYDSRTVPMALPVYLLLKEKH